jgi:L-rhamnose mutarotase
VLERLAGERTCGRKTMDEIARSLDQEGGGSGAVKNGTVQSGRIYMSDIMAYNPENTPAASGLKEVFHLD